MASYSKAAARHHADAEELLRRQRFVTADHLAGLAVECALKALLLGVAGVSAGPKGIQRRFAQHGSALCSEVINYITSPIEASYFQPILNVDPYGSWSVNDRYEDGVRAAGGGPIRPIDTQRLIRAAYDLLVELQRAQRDGYTVPS